MIISFLILVIVVLLIMAGLIFNMSLHRRNDLNRDPRDPTVLMP